ncbi:Chloroperoxidase [Amylocarpus encephaloides]|uniref:Chloroperoxidase n=1 Tax=Amylocarpus encephaloides TaxID=45428 RepID=A0A9P8CA34_9HELO|nr:Chloroperoxidase [Amylocarpus encephaloides]
MKYSTAILSALALCISEVVAYPSAAFEYAAKAERDASTQESLEAAMRKHQNKGRAVGFDPTAQYVSNQGKYAFKAPNLAGGDQRGPCPGLNAMANHGYLPSNGVATIQQFIDSTLKVFGMGKDLGGFLSIYGALIDGDGTKWSIGGPTPYVPGLLGLLGTPQGISGSHNKYEGDASPTRPDLYQYGNDYKVIVPQFKQLYDMQPNAATANYDLDVLTDFRASRFQQSIDNNPYFFNGPFSGVLVQPAAYTFIFRFMGNKSAEYPEGRLNQEVLKSFFSITGDSNNLKWTEGNEKIPNNWYKRAIGDEYTIPFFLTDVLAAAAQHPEFLSIGGNTGTTNSFTGVDITDLTDGVFNGATLLKGNNLACFVFQNLQNAVPDLIKGLFLNPSGPLGQLTSAISSVTAPFVCPNLAKFDRSQFDKFPGSKGFVA